MKFCVLFLIILNAPITNYHILFTSIKVFLFWEFFELFQWDVLIREYCHVHFDASSFFMTFDYYIRSVCIYFSIRVNSEIPWYGYIISFY